jgi:hypothetical protein
MIMISVNLLFSRLSFRKRVRGSHAENGNNKRGAIRKIPVFHSTKEWYRFS